MSKKKNTIEVSLEQDEDITIKEQEIISKFTEKLKDRTKYALSGILVGSCMSPLTAIIIIIMFCVLIGDTYYIKDGFTLLYHCLYTLYVKNSKKKE